MMAKRTQHIAPRKRRAGTFDIVVGQYIRAHRHALHISQAALADDVDVTFQQIQKYEKGSNRVSLARFVRIARALKAHPMEMLEQIIKEARA